MNVFRNMNIILIDRLTILINWILIILANTFLFLWTIIIPIKYFRNLVLLNKITLIIILLNGNFRIQFLSIYLLDFLSIHLWEKLLSLLIFIIFKFILLFLKVKFQLSAWLIHCFLLFLDYVNYLWTCIPTFHVSFIFYGFCWVYFFYLVFFLFILFWFIIQADQFTRHGLLLWLII